MLSTGGSLLCALLGTLLTLDPTSSDPWLSPVRELVDQVSLVDQVVDIYVDNELRRLADIRSKLAEHRARLERLKGSNYDGASPDVNTDEYLAHPLNSFQIIRSWFDLQNAFNNKDNPFTDVYTRLRRKKLRLPDHQSTISLLKNLLRAQILYNVSTEQFVTGNISGHATEHRLDATDMVEMSYLAQEFSHYVISAQWMIRAIQHADPADLGRIDGYVDSLVWSLTRLTDKEVIPSTALLELERWIYVQNRDASTRAGVMQGLLPVLEGAEKSYHLTNEDVQYKPCPAADPLGTVENEHMRVLDTTLSESETRGMEKLINDLWQMSFHIEGLRSHVAPEILDVEQTEYVSKIMDAIANEAERLCPTCDIREAIDSRLYSFKVKYDSGGYPGMEFTIETRLFRNSREGRMSGIHAVIFGSEPDQGAVIPIPGGPAVIPQKGRGLIWRVEDVHFNKQRPLYCPVLYGQRTLLHVFIRTR